MNSLQDFSWVTYIRQPDASEILIYFLLFLSTYYFLPGKARLAMLLAPLWLWLVLQQSPAHPQQKLVITMLDVGQGESLHIRYPDGTDALIDTGGLFFSPDKDNTFVGERLVSRYLWKERSQKLDYVLLTHPDADHIQGYGFIREAFPIQVAFSFTTSPIMNSGRLQLASSFRMETAFPLLESINTSH